MSQYKTGTVSVTNGSATVTGSGTLWSTEIAAGQWFGVDADGVTYQVSAVGSDTQLTLSTNYAGTTGSGKTYFVVRDYTSPDSIPILAPNDIATATVFARAISKIQDLLSARQPLDADLTAIAALAPADGKILVRSGGVWASGERIHKNGILNGIPLVWQDGTSFTSIASGVYVADNWRYNKSGTMVHDASQNSTYVPSVAAAGVKVPYAVYTICTTADASIAAGDYALLASFIEGYPWLRYAQQEFTLSGYLTATKTGIYCVALQNSGTDRSYVFEVNIAAADTPTFFSKTIPASPTGGTWYYDYRTGLRVTFIIAAGSTYQTTADAWQTGDYFATANQVNGCDAINNKFAVTGLRIDPGPIVGAWHPDDLDYSKVLDGCKYFYRLHGGLAAYEHLPGSHRPNGATNAISHIDVGSMRVTPTLIVSSASHWSISDMVTGVPFTGVALHGESTARVVRLDWSGAAGLTIGNSSMIYTSNTLSARLALSARF